jgi:hypothetical protein
MKKEVDIKLIYTKRNCWHLFPLYAAIAIVGVGESTTLIGLGVMSPSPELLFSLGRALLSTLLSLSAVSVTPS